MAKYKPYNYAQDMFIPVSLKDQLMPGSLEYAIHTLVDERMDMSLFDEKFSNDDTGRKAYDPRILLKVVLMGYSRGLTSSRKIEQACHENVVFMALSCCQHPDHSTISTFVSSMKDEILPLFGDVLLICEELKLLGGTHFALDGCKLSCNASPRWSRTISELRQKRIKLEERVKDLLKEQEDEDHKDSSGNRSYSEKQIDKLKKQADRIETWLNNNGERLGVRGKEIKSNMTDNESSKMVTSNGTIQGYNSQALVDSKHQIIVHADVFGTGQDTDIIPPIVDGAKENMEKTGFSEDYFKGKILTADTGYHSRMNIQKCIDEGIDAYIPDKNFRKRDPRFNSRKGRSVRTHYGLKDFQYDEENDKYICPQGKRLRLNVKKCKATGNIYKRYVAESNDCSQCPVKHKCIYGNGCGPKLLMVPIGFEGNNLTKLMIEKIESDKGRKIYSQRMAIVEPVFANIRTHKHLDRFTLRGKGKVNIQWLLFCMVHNIGKIATYGYA
ncbi:MAG: IS1182 family transposase [Methanosarcinaceae archaeon]|nr:IS1182 family transposase [Methanosarcinaceae archaeon]